MLLNKLSHAAQGSQLQAKRVDARTVLFETEASENLRVATEMFVDGGLPGKVVLIVVSTKVVLPILPDLVALQDRLIVGCRDVAYGPKPQ